jgi:hypothetical protein
MSEGPGSPAPDAAWDREQRNETALERLDRNWVDLLQELRVIQTGVQLLTGFLLILPFQARFEQLTLFQQNVYLLTLAAAVIATGFLIAPVSLHRFLFRQHARRITVDVAHRLAQIGLSLLALAMIGVVLLIFDLVLGLTGGLIAAGSVAIVLIGLWVVLPLVIRDRHDQQP